MTKTFHYFQRLLYKLVSLFTLLQPKWGQCINKPPSVTTWDVKCECTPGKTGPSCDQVITCFYHTPKKTCTSICSDVATKSEFREFYSSLHQMQVKERNQGSKNGNGIHMKDLLSV